MRQTSQVLYIAVDSLVPVRGKCLLGFDEFTASLDHAGIPAVWLTNRSRLQFDEPRRRLGHRHPFIAEGGCAVYLPEDYFHLRPKEAPGHSAKSATIRLGRFTCIPVADLLPAAAEKLGELSRETSVPIVTLRSLSPKELAQNTGLPQREAELVRQRDFDDMFFFAGVSDAQVQHFLSEGRKRKLDFRQHGVLWSVAAGVNIQRCVRELSKLYDRALHHHAQTVAMGTQESALNLFPFCDRSILLMERAKEEETGEEAYRRRAHQIPLDSADRWERVLQIVAS